MTRLEARGLTVRYGFGDSAFTAVDRVGLSVPAGATLGLVGESGSGKSTVARALVRLVEATAGEVLLDGQPLSEGGRLADFRRRVQMVFQDPSSSLNQRMTVGSTIAEAVGTYRKLGRADLAKEVNRLLELVGLDPSAAERYPHQFSGGQRQRVAIARALAVQPDVLILDEVTSALDVSVQATVLNLLRELQGRLGLSYLFISHNLSVVRYMSDQVAVMYLGRIVECDSAEELFLRPKHPYTRALMDAVPARGGTGIRLFGEIPDPRRPPSGCRFRTRCPIGPAAHPERTSCSEADPQAGAPYGAAMVACHYPLHHLDSEQRGGGRG